MNKLNDPSVKIMAFQDDKKGFAVRFSMNTWTEGDEKRVTAGARQLITDGMMRQRCPYKATDCRTDELRCKVGFAICGFQAQISGRNGTFGGMYLKNV